MIRDGRFAEADALIPAEGAAAFGALLRALARKGLGEPDRPLLETLDEIETDVDEECTKYLNEILYLFGKEDAGAFFVSNLTAARQEGIQSKVLDIILARTLMNLERYEEAESILTAALERFGSDKAIHYALAVVYEDLKRVLETETHLKAVLKFKPDDPEILNFLGYLYADHNMNLDKAEALLKRALEIQPESGFYLDSLGWVYYRKGNADRAIELIRKAILAMDRDDAEVRDHLGDAYLLKGDTDKAVAEWSRAHRLDPKRPGVKEKLDQYQK
jgi:tetratricopeptide (TPR) repeat protein